MMQESARLLKLHPMETSRPDLYYVYYATLALYHEDPQAQRMLRDWRLQDENLGSEKESDSKKRKSPEEKQQGSVQAAPQERQEKRRRV